MSDRVSKAVASVLRSNISHVSLAQKAKGRFIKTGIGVLDNPIEHRARVGELVEFVGVSTAGKTQLLHTVAATALLNAKGSQKPVVCWFDLNGGFNLSRLTQLIGQRKRNIYGMDEGGSCDPATGLLLYNPESTLAMCASLHSLPSFMSTSEGSNVTTVIIDALGMFHYLDKYHNKPISDGKGKAAPGAGTDEFMLVNVLKQLLDVRRVTVFVSKCALYDEEVLSVKWPFSEAGIPSIPREFMPSSWASLVSHCVLVYHIKHDVLGDGSSSVQRRGVVRLVRKLGQYSSRQLHIAAASTLVIDDNGISEDEDQIHVVN